MFQNITKTRLLGGQVAFGLSLRFARSVEIAHAAAAAGIHYLYIDLEHAAMDPDVARQISVAALGVGVTSLIRVPQDETSVGVRLLDGGAQGIVVPHVETAEQARQAVDAYCYAPRGNRSGIGSTIHFGWEPLPTIEVMARANEQTMIVALLESREGIANVDDIAAVEGIDVLAIGSMDLTMEMGIAGQFEHPDLLAAYDKVINAARRHGKGLRLGGVYSPQLLRRNIELGSRMVTLGDDFSLLLATLREKTAEATTYLPDGVL